MTSSPSPSSSLLSSSKQGELSHLQCKDYPNLCDFINQVDIYSTIQQKITKFYEKIKENKETIERKENEIQTLRRNLESETTTQNAELVARIEGLQRDLEQKTIEIKNQQDQITSFQKFLEAIDNKITEHWSRLQELAKQ